MVSTMRNDAVVRGRIEDVSSPHEMQMWIRHQLQVAGGMRKAPPRGNLPDELQAAARSSGAFDSSREDAAAGSRSTGRWATSPAAVEGGGKRSPRKRGRSSKSSNNKQGNKRSAKVMPFEADMLLDGAGAGRGSIAGGGYFGDSLSY